MSYDLQLFEPPPGTDPLVAARAALDVDIESVNPGPVDSKREAWKEVLASALLAADPVLERFRFDYPEIAKLRGLSEEEARREFRHIELNAPENGNGLQIQLFDKTVSVAIPYWHRGEKAETTWSEIWKCLQVCRDTGGLAVYDPQLDRVLDLENDRDAVLQMYAQGMQFTDSVARGAETPPKPWWKFW